MKLDNTTIREAVALWCEDQNTCIQSFGHISTWDTSEVTDMSELFIDADEFNSPIGNWNVSNVTNMELMFCDANSFNQPIGSWDVGNVTNMNRMFCNSNNFNKPIGTWNVSNVTNMDSMFSCAFAFNQPIDSWNVSKVINMGSMFYQATAFNQPIGSWNVRNVTNMGGMFDGASDFNQPIGSWDVGNVTNMNRMFGNSTVFNKPIGSWDVSNVTNMDFMFSYAYAFNQPIDSWNVSKVTTMSFMFKNATSFNQSISSWDVGNVIYMNHMFCDATSFNQNIGSWNVSKVTTMSYMFSNATSFNQPIDSWNLSKVTNTELMFSNANANNQPNIFWNVDNEEEENKDESDEDNEYDNDNSFHLGYILGQISYEDEYELEDITLYCIQVEYDDCDFGFEGIIWISFDEETDEPYRVIEVPDDFDLEENIGGNYSLGSFNSYDEAKRFIENLKTISFNKLKELTGYPDNENLCYFRTKKKEKEILSSDDFKTVIVKTHHENGKIKEEIETVNDKLHGLYKLYHDNGQLRVFTRFENGLQVDGVVDSFDENGFLIRTVELKKGNKNGPYKEFYPSGRIKKEGRYKDNEIIGKSIEYFENGNIKDEYYLVNGVMIESSAFEQSDFYKFFIKKTEEVLLNLDIKDKSIYDFYYDLETIESTIIIGDKENVLLNFAEIRIYSNKCEDQDDEHDSLGEIETPFIISYSSEIEDYILLTNFPKYRINEDAENMNNATVIRNLTFDELVVTFKEMKEIDMSKIEINDSDNFTYYEDGSIKDDNEENVKLNFNDMKLIIKELKVETILVDFVNSWNKNIVCKDHQLEIETIYDFANERCFYHDIFVIEMDKENNCLFLEIASPFEAFPTISKLYNNDYLMITKSLSTKTNIESDYNDDDDEYEDDDYEEVLEYTIFTAEDCLGYNNQIGFKGGEYKSKLYMSETDWDLYNNLEDENNFDIDLISYQTVHFVRKKDFEVGKWFQTIKSFDLYDWDTYPNKF